MFDFRRSKNKREVKIVCECFYFMNPSKINIMFKKKNKRKINQQKKIFELRYPKKKVIFVNTQMSY